MGRPSLKIETKNYHYKENKWTEFDLWNISNVVKIFQNCRNSLVIPLMSLDISEGILVINVLFICVCWLCPVPGDSLGDNRRSVLSNIGTKKKNTLQRGLDFTFLEYRNSCPSLLHIWRSLGWISNIALSWQLT